MDSLWRPASLLHVAGQWQHGLVFSRENSVKLQCHAGAHLVEDNDPRVGSVLQRAM